MDSTAVSGPRHRRRAEPVRALGPTGARRLLTVLTLGALLALGPLSIDMYLPALPAISADLRASSSSVPLTLAGTWLGLGLGQLFVGPLSDTVGRRPPLIVGTVLHIAASILCLVAPNVAVLGVLRVLQGVAGAATMVVAMAVIRDLFTGREVATVLSRLMLVVGAAPVFAPTLGGVILLVGSWHAVFAAPAALGGLLLVVVLTTVQETLPPERWRTGGFRPVTRAFTIVLRDGRFVIMALVSSLAMAAMFAYVSGASFVLRDGYGLREQEFALALGAGAAALIATSQLNVMLLARWAAQRIMLRALAVATAISLVLTPLAASGEGGVASFVILLWLITAAVGFVLPNGAALTLSRHGEAADTATALLGAGQFGLGAVVAPLVGLLGNNAHAMAVVMTACVAAALVLAGAVPFQEPQTGPTDVAPV
ncbi:multidrug effflux MFS transporter [Streptomyces sp. NPDC057062]|uniref:multidrug effflux MFS transporter n=1 Tax=Streptomyces sp. NPDC057062 TaxID=3346011 RepID=UPI00362C9CF1